MRSEEVWLYAAMGLYFCAAAVAVVAQRNRATAFRGPTLVLVAAIAVHSVAIGLRWDRLEHGPYVDLFEVLSSNIWSLHLAVLVGVLIVPRIRSTLAVTLPLLQVLVLWLLTVPAPDREAPVTYDTIWLPIHIGLGKVFLGCVLIAVGLALVILGRGVVVSAFRALPANGALDVLAHRFVLVAFIFESLMLIAGAIWAQDAWGRYWAWDPLETWAFVTWLAVIGYLHVRSLRRPSPTLNAVLIVAIFGIAFATFFGMPFVSTAPHKGAI